ncbi:MAG: ABC transporter substrate-binding protein [Phycisphaerae bacterium]|nr:ABC transporter substrate-binding protein [Phycisphaerae bacterium]
MKGFGLLILAGTLLPGIADSLAADPLTRKEIVVGCPLPLKYSYGQNGLRGLTLAVEQINAEGGITLQGKAYPVRLEFLDTDDQNPNVPERQVMEKLKLLLKNKKPDVLIGGPCLSEYGLAAMDVVAEHDAVHIVSVGCYTPKWDTIKFASDPRKYRKSFRVSGSVAWYLREAGDLLHFLKEQYGFRKMFILNQNALMCRDAAAIVKKIAVKDGWEIVGHESVPSETADFTKVLRRCRTAKAQLLFLWYYSPNSANLFKQWMDMEIPALPMGFVQAAESPDFWKQTHGKCAYSVVTLSEAGVTLSDVTPLSRGFFNAYKKRWGVPPRSSAAAASYEALFVFQDAAQRAGSLTPDALIPALETCDLPVVRGRLRFDKNHQCLFGYDPRTTILGNWIQWQNEKRVTIWPPAARTGELKIPPFLQWYWLQKKVLLKPAKTETIP